MGIATRDFIPQEEGLTGLERARNERGRMIRTGSNHADFIPDPSDPTVPVDKRRNEMERADRAQAAANARSLAGAEMEWKAAVERLKMWSPAQAVDAIAGMPFRIMEMYVVCEMAHAARQDILNVFPAPDPKVVEQFAPQLLSGTSVPIQPEIVEESTPIAEIGEDVPVPDEVGPVEAPSPEEAIQETYLCIDCGQAAKTLAGLKAHERAKHGIGDADAVTEPQAGE